MQIGRDARQPVGGEVARVQGCCDGHGHRQLLLEARCQAPREHGSRLRYGYLSGVRPRCHQC